MSNDHEASGLLEWTLECGYELRFIEQVPLDADRGWTERGMITAPEIRTLLSAGFVLERDRRLRNGAPAERLKYDDGTPPPVKPKGVSWVPLGSSRPSANPFVPIAKPRAHGMDHAGLGTEDFVQPDRSMSAIGG